MIFPPTPDAEALELEVQQLYGQHAAALLRYAGAIMRTPEVGADAVQEVFLRYFVERTYGRTIDNPRAWLFRVLRNYLVDSLKSTESKQEVIAQDMELLADDQQDPEARLRQSQTAQNLVGLLSPRERESLGLRSEGLSYDEIAQAMGLATGTVGALLARAYRKLRGRVTSDPAADSIPMAEAVRLILLREKNG